MSPTAPRSEDASPRADAVASGEETAADRLLPLVYDQLRRAAQIRLAGERAGHTLQATALVHEVYLKLLGPREVPWQGRAHFYAAAADAMRQVLLDHAKARGRGKRGGGFRRVDLDDVATLAGPVTDDSAPDREDFVALDDAIRRLARKDPRMAEIVRLRFYAGLEVSQVALVLDVSERTVKSDWAFARAWLERETRPPLGAE